MTFLHSTIGKKIIVAITGLLLVGFVIAHMVGNLQVFLGPEKINNYAALLKSEPLILWGARLGLLLSAALHIIFTVQLTARNRASRPERYAEYEATHASAASRTMIWGGMVLILFVVYHLLHFTIGLAHPNFSHTDVYSNLIIGFSSPLVSGFYILGMFALGMHLYHGVSSVFQTLGFNVRCWKHRIALGLALLVPAGFVSIPIAVLSGVLK